MKVTFGETFARYYLNFPKADQAKIRAFINYVENYGLTGLTGRNKNSDNVPKDDPHWSQKVAYAQKHKLWHYHIGIPYYETANNGEQIRAYPHL